MPKSKIKGGGTKKVCLPYERHSKYSEFDIVYYCGLLGKKWNPEQKSLVGSEQAVVKLSSYWSSKGYKVCVYSDFEKKYECNGVK